MPQKHEHLKKSAEAELLAVSLDLQLPGAADWAVTMLFYSALHQIEAYFAIAGVHSRSHKLRDNSVDHDRNTYSLYKAYVVMKIYSMNARYTALRFGAADVNKMKTYLDIMKEHLAPFLTASRA